MCVPFIAKCSSNALRKQSINRFIVNYYLIAQLLQKRYNTYALDWYGRAAMTAVDFGLDSATVEYLENVSTLARSRQDRPRVDRPSDGSRKSRKKWGRDEGMGANAENKVDNRVENVDDITREFVEAAAEVDAVLEDKTLSVQQKVHTYLRQVLSDDHREGTEHIRNILNTDIASNEGGMQPSTPKKKRIMRGRRGILANASSQREWMERKGGEEKEIGKGKGKDKGKGIKPWVPSGMNTLRGLPPSTSHMRGGVDEMKILRLRARIKTNVCKSCKAADTLTAFNHLDKQGIGSIYTTDVNNLIRQLEPGITEKQQQTLYKSVGLDEEKLTLNRFELLILLEGNIARQQSISREPLSRLSRNKSDSRLYTPSQLSRAVSLPILSREESKKLEQAITVLVLESQRRIDTEATVTVSDNVINGISPNVDENISSVPLGSHSRDGVIDNEIETLRLRRDYDAEINKLIMQAQTGTGAEDFTHRGGEQSYTSQVPKSVVCMQALGRGYIARKRVKAIVSQRKFEARRRLMRKAVIDIQRVSRGYNARKCLATTKRALAVCTSPHQNQANVMDEDRERLIAEEMAELHLLRKKMEEIRQQTDFMSPMQVYVT